MSTDEQQPPLDRRARRARAPPWRSNAMVRALQAAIRARPDESAEVLGRAGRPGVHFSRTRSRRPTQPGEMGQHQRLRDTRTFFQYAAVREFCEPVERSPAVRCVRSTAASTPKVDGMAIETFILYPRARRAVANRPGGRRGLTRGYQSVAGCTWQRRACRAPGPSTRPAAPYRLTAPPVRCAPPFISWLDNGAPRTSIRCDETFRFLSGIDTQVEGLWMDSLRLHPVGYAGPSRIEAAADTRASQGV